MTTTLTDALRARWGSAEMDSRCGSCRPGETHADHIARVTDEFNRDLDADPKYGRSGPGGEVGGDVDSERPPLRSGDGSGSGRSSSSASIKQRLFLLSLTFQKEQHGANDDAGRASARRLVLDPTARKRDVSELIDELVGYRWRSDCYIGRVPDEVVSSGLDDDDLAPVQAALYWLVDREGEAIAERRHADAPGETDDRPVEPATGVTGTRVPDGYFTVVLTSGERRTLRVTTVRSGNLAGRRIVKYLAGPSNETDYVGFGFVDDDGVSLWKRYRDDSTLAEAVRVLWSDPLAAGKGYALESENCFVCNRLLTEPESIEAGIGPVCREKIGV